MVPSRKFLLCVDGSECSKRAAIKAGECAMSQRNDVVHIVSVVPLVEVGEEAPSQVVAKRTKEAEEAVAEAKRLVLLQQNNFLATTTEVMENEDVRSCICKLGETYDVVVMGSSGKGGVETFLLGSVAQYVLSHCPADVLIVRPQQKKK